MLSVWGERYPAIRLGVIVVLSILFIRFTQLDQLLDANLIPWIAVIAVVAIIGSASLTKIRPVVAFCLIGLSVFLILLVRSADLTRSESNDISALAGLSKPVRVAGIVDEDPIDRGSSFRYVIRVDSIWISEHLGFPIQGRIAVTSSVRGARYGQHLTLTGVLRKPPGERNPGEFDYARYLASQGIGGTLSIKEAWQEKRGAIVRQPTFLQRFRRQLYETNKELLPATEASLVNAMLLGLRQDIPDEIRAAYSNTGTIHVLALSGLHTAFIIAMILGVLGFLRVPYRVRMLLGIAGLWFYVALVDFMPSVTRAALMATVILTGHLLQKRSSVVNSLFAALCLILIASPDELFDLGLQLSFLAVLAIVVIHPRLEALIGHFIPALSRWRGLPRHALQLFLVSVAAQLGTVPLTMYYFNNLPLLAIIANLVVVPLSGVILALDLATQFSHFVSPALAQWYANVTDILTGAMITVVQAAQSMPLASVRVWTFGVDQLVLCYVILAAIVLWRVVIIRKIAMIGVLMAVCMWTWEKGLREPKLRVTFLDVGQGDACVIQFPDDRVMCIDAGDSRGDWNYGSKVIAPFLHRQGILQIDFLVLSHPHDDHVGGASALLSEFEVKHIWHSGQFYRSDAVRAIDSITVARSIASSSVHAGDFFAIDKRTRLYFLHPDSTSVNSKGKAARGTNNASVVMMMEFDKTRWLFMGDAEVDAINLFSRYDGFLDADIIKVSHHGSWNGTTRELTRLTSPQFAVISCGDLNMFHHPSDVTLQILSQSGAKICRTDRSGAIQFESDGRGIEQIR